VSRAGALIVSVVWLATGCSAGSDSVSGARPTTVAPEWSSVADMHGAVPGAPPPPPESGAGPKTVPASPAATVVASPPTTAATTLALAPMPRVEFVLGAPDGGFAESQGLSGGLGHGVVYVTSSADAGAGTYREAISSGDRIVRFDPSLNGATIALESPVETAASNLTIDASGLSITITRHATRFSGSNIVVAGLAFVDNDDTDEEDAVTFRESESGQVFGLYGNTFEHAADGLVDVIWSYGHDVHATICGNAFRHHDKAMLIDSGEDDREGGRYHVTLCRNHWVDVYQRMPLSRWALVHQYNSVFDSYGKPDGDGGGSKSGGDGDGVSQHLLEANMVFPRQVGEVTFEDKEVTSPRAEWAASQLGSDGAVKVAGNYLATVGDVTATEFEHDAEEVFEPPYEYRALPATPGLADVVRATAGVCLASNRSDVVNPCAPVIIDDEDGMLTLAVKSVDGAGAAAIVDVEFVVGEQRVAGRRLVDGSWALDIADLGPTPVPVWAIASTADGRHAESDLVVVSNVS
jgi:pectate lyase